MKIIIYKKRIIIININVILIYNINNNIIIIIMNKYKYVILKMINRLLIIYNNMVIKIKLYDLYILLYKQ